MNIFFTDIDPFKCASFLDDTRVVKMCTETAQMLSTAVRYTGMDVGYKVTHPNHPSNIWVRTSKQNFEWLINHGIALCLEYTKRYHKAHKAEQLIIDLCKYSDRFPSLGLTVLPNCAANKKLGLDFRHEATIYISYRSYLMKRFSLAKRPAKCRVHLDICDECFGTGCNLCEE